MPPTTSCDSTTSRVVPGRSVTMARSQRLQALSRLDLPTLGRPTMATLSPIRSSCPASAVAKMCSTSPSTAATWARTAPSSRGGRSSSKSTRASTSASTSRQVDRSWRIGAISLPCTPARAVRAARVDWAATRSATPSAWVRSRRPFKKARRVNSPGSASRAPWLRQSWSTCCTAINPPWQ